MLTLHAPLSMMLLLVCALSSPSFVIGDLYMVHPRGSNNKLEEVSTNVRNDNRLFDSQNNARAGYNVGDNCRGSCSYDSNGDGNADPDTYDPERPGAGEGEMYFYGGSLLSVEWTAQHGCGSDNPLIDCTIVLQYACEDTMPGLRNGKTRATIGGGHNENGQNTNEVSK